MSKWKASSAGSMGIIAAFAVAFVVTGYSAWQGKCETFDEPLHFLGAWVQTHYGDARCDPEDPPLWHYYLAAGFPKRAIELSTSGVVWDSMLLDRAVEGLFTRDVFYHTRGNSLEYLISAARDRMIVIGALLGFAIAWWGWRLGGPRAGMIAAGFYFFDPNFLAHAPLIKNDVLTALALLMLVAAIEFLGRRVTPWRVGAVFLLLGVSLMVKFSGVLGIPILGGCLLVRAMLREPWPAFRWVAATRIQRVILAGVICLGGYLFAYGFIWMCYGFRYAPGSDPKQLFDFGELVRIAARHHAFAAYNAFDLPESQIAAFTANWHPGLLYRGVQWVGVHRVVPQPWAEGFLFLYGTAPGRNAFLLGDCSMTGWWYYYPIAFLVKTPLATLVGLVLGGIYLAVVRFRVASLWGTFMFVVLPSMFLVTAMRSGLDLGIRYVLAVYPFLFIFLGIVGANALVRVHKPARIVVVALLAGLIVETYFAYPDFIPFINVAAGGWRSGPDLLGDSNIDWGQDLPALAQWERDHPQYQVFLNYFGFADPRPFEIHYVNLPGSLAPADESPSPSRPRVYAISGTAGQNPWLAEGDRKFYLELRGQRPLAVLGHCIYLYNPP